MRRFFAIAICVILGVIISGFPARWALSFSGDNVKQLIDPISVRGTVWRGEATLSPSNLNWPIKTHYNINLMRWLGGASALELFIKAPGTDITGGLSPKQAKDVVAQINVSNLPIFDPRFQGIKGVISARIETLDFSQGCVEAKGVMRTNVLASNQAHWQWLGPVLSGPIRCDQDRLKIELSGEDDAQSISAIVWLDDAGQYDIEVLADLKASAPPEAAFVAGALGFQETDQGFRLREKGSLYVSGLGY